MELVANAGGRILVAAIRAYRRWPVVKQAVRLAVTAHHMALPAARQPCSLRDCSGTGLAEAQGSGLRALPDILHRMSACGVEWDDCMVPGRGPGCLSGVLTRGMR